MSTIGLRYFNTVPFVPFDKVFCEYSILIDIAPHSSWNGIPSSFIEAHLAYEKKFSFGQEGKPHYVSGPNDYELYNVEEVVKKVLKAQGHYVVHLSG